LHGVIEKLPKFISIPYSVAFFLLPDTSPYFIAGSCFYLVRREGWDKLTTSLIIISYCYAAYLLSVHIEVLSSHYHAVFNLPLTIGILSFFYILFTLLSLNKLSSINKPFMLSLGVMTYPLYLLHQNIGYMLFNVIGNDISRWITLPIVILLMMSLALLVHHKIEKQFGSKLKRALTKAFVKS